MTRRRPAPYGRRLLALSLVVSVPGAIGMAVLGAFELGAPVEIAIIVAATLASIGLAVSAHRFAIRPLATLAACRARFAVYRARRSARGRSMTARVSHR